MLRARSPRSFAKDELLFLFLAMSLSREAPEKCLMDMIFFTSMVPPPLHGVLLLNVTTRLSPPKAPKVGADLLDDVAVAACNAFGEVLRFASRSATHETVVFCVCVCAAGVGGGAA